MARLKIEKKTFEVNTEAEALSLIQEYKDNQIVDGYTLSDYGTKYKLKKDKKTGEIIEEHWDVTVVKNYDVF